LIARFDLLCFVCFQSFLGEAFACRRGGGAACLKELPRFGVLLIVTQPCGSPNFRSTVLTGRAISIVARSLELCPRLGYLPEEALVFGKALEAFLRNM
jgi:hypothetical protein